MPRDIGTGVYHYPDGTQGNSGQTIFSARYNTFVNDLANTLNQPLPVNMGGTGASLVHEARENLDVEVAAQQVTNYDEHLWETGSFYSLANATGRPADADISGVCVIIEKGATDDITLVAFNNTTGTRYTRAKVNGEWSTWADETVLLDTRYINVTGDTMTGALTLSGDPTDPQHATDKQYVDAQDALKVSKAGDTMTGVLVADAGITSNSDLTVARVSTGAPTTGAVFFGNAGGKYLYYDGTNFQLTGATTLVVNGSLTTQGGNISTNAISCSTITTNGAAITAGAINCGDISATTVGATAHQGLGVTVPAGSYANVVHTVSGVRQWWTGCWNDGAYRIYDASGGSSRVTIDPNAGTTIPGALTTGSIVTTGNINTSGNTITTGAVDATGAVQAGAAFNFATGGAYTVLLTDGTNSYIRPRWLDSIYFQGGNGGTYARAHPDGFDVKGSGNLRVDTQAYKPGGGPFADISDARIKNVLGDYNNGLDAIKALRPVRYTFKGNDTPSGTAPENVKEADTKEAVTVPYGNSPHYNSAVENKEHIGLIAQEVEGVMPEMVSQRAATIDGQPVTDMRDLDPNALVYALINSCKELAARVEALEAAQATP